MNGINRRASSISKCVWVGSLVYDSANVERWRSEINTFHFNIHIGEMTSMLFDVYEILRLVVDGNPITCPPINDLRQYMEDHLGIVPDGNLTNLRHTWLKVNFRELPPDATPIQVYKYTRAYLLFLISVTIFVDASVSTVPARAKRWEPPKKYHGNPHYLMSPIRQELDNLQPNEVIWNPYFKPDEVISDDRQQAYQTAMCITTLIFDDIAKPYMPDRIHPQFGVEQGIPRNPLVVSKRANRQENTDNGPSEEYKAWYNLVSHPLIHNVANPPKDIATSYPRRRRCVQASTVRLAEALTLRQKWYPEVYNLVNNVFETLSKFVPMDIGDIEAGIEILQRQYNDECVPNEAGHDGVGKNTWVVEDLAPSTQPAVEEPRRYNTQKKQYQPKRR
ncbi:hypothetical protein AMTR_s00028p00195620 [Amborella trichopoda]|uniref:Aminotransferase-like plant mobile domain-containing protein n=1 Tax=Amborella trichopoda TaxID=13333 RepID=W1PS22_AMBTC|nr:hypothetical protein AMTR_s00028p00195620 [Amborella trichopoda]